MDNDAPPGLASRSKLFFRSAILADAGLPRTHHHGQQKGEGKHAHVCIYRYVLSSFVVHAGQYVSARHGENRLSGCSAGCSLRRRKISFAHGRLGLAWARWLIHVQNHHLTLDSCSLGLPLVICVMRQALAEGMIPDTLKRAHEWIEVREDLLSRVKSLDPKLDANDRNIRPMYAHLLLALRRATITLIRIIVDGQVAVGDGRSAAGEDVDGGCLMWRGTNYLAKIWYSQVLHLHLFS